MVILDQLGSKVWGQLIDPVQAFQTIINSVSYNNEIKNIRSSFRRSVLVSAAVICVGREMAIKKIPFHLQAKKS